MGDSKTIHDLDRKLLSKMIIENYKNTSGNINEDEYISLHIVHPVVMSLLNYGTIKRIVYNIFGLAKKDWAITACKMIPNGSSTQLLEGVDAPSPVCGNYTMDLDFTKHIQHLMYLEFKGMTDSNSFREKIITNTGSRDEGLMGIQGITLTMEPTVRSVIHNSIRSIVYSEKELTRESIAYDAGSTLNVTSAIMRTVEKHYNDIFILWNTMLSIKNHIQISDAKGTIYEFRHKFFVDNWEKLFLIYVKVAVRDYIVENYMGPTSTVAFPNLIDVTNVSIDTDLATGIPSIAAAPVSLQPCTLTTAMNAETTSNLRKDYHTYKSRMISMENKEETMKQRLRASNIQKITYLVLYLLFLFSMIAFLIIKVPISIDMKAKVTLVICSIIIVSLTVSDLVKMFKGRL